MTPSHPQNDRNQERLNAYMQAHMDAHVALATLSTALDVHRNDVRTTQYQPGQIAHVEALATKLEALHRWFTEG